MKTHCFRLTRGTDLLSALRSYVTEHDLSAAVLLSAVGSLSEARIRCADGVTVHTIEKPLEIVSLFGTLSKERCHLHIALSDTDLHTVGGHLMDGCLIHTTAEIVLLALNDVRFSSVFDEETGYRELLILPR